MHEDVSEPKPNGAPPEAYAPDGVDLTLIRWMLSLTPAERLEILEKTVRALRMLRNEEANA